MPHDIAFETRLGTTDERPPRPQPRPRRDPCEGECKPVCPACGGLECLCRPRFFPGQLLTDDDLNRLSRYIVEKNKLHNRYLHGWGVACGLEVTCNGCDPQEVVVGTGYALSPCGDDIIVCRDQAVKICELIEQCRPAREPVCDPPYDRPPRDCRGGNNRWVLAICYDERPSRGVTALLGAADNACKSPCSCGGSASCGKCGGSGCGCGGSSAEGGCGCSGAPAKTNFRPRKQLKKNCEPTQMCEGYHFVVYPEPVRKTEPRPATPDALIAWLFANRKQFGALLERVFCCMQRAAEVRETMHARNASGIVSLEAYRSYLEAVRDFAEQFGIHRCSFVGSVDSMYVDGTNWIRQREGLQRLDAESGSQLKQRISQLDAAWLDIVSECFCSALLPTCPETPMSNCVPLAVVTLRANDCRVVEICNWQVRKLLITWRTVGYWLSWLPWNCLRQTFAKMCCGDGRENSALTMLAVMLGVAKTGLACGQDNKYTPYDGSTPERAVPRAGTLALRSTAGAGVIGAAASAADTAATGSMVAAAFEPTMDADNLFVHLLGEFDRMRAGTAAAPLWAKVAAHLADGSALHILAGNAPNTTQGVEALKEVQSQLTSLRHQVDSQQQVIDQLRPKRAERPRRRMK